MLRRASLAVLLFLAACKSRTKPPPAPGSSAPAAPAAAAADATRPLTLSIDPPAAAGALAPNLRDSGDDVLATWLEPVAEAAKAAKAASAANAANATSATAAPEAKPAHRLRFARWSKGAWSAPVTIVESPRLVANWADVPAVARAGDGALVAQWAEASDGETHAYDAIVARSVDGGATWKRLGPLHDDATATEHGFVSLLGEADSVRAFWLDGRATASASGAMTLRTATVAEQVGRGELVDDRVCDCCGTAAATTANGALVAYRDRSADDVRDIAVSRHTTAVTAAAWSPPSLVHRDGWQIAGCPVNGPALAARGQRVAIAWYTYADSTHRIRAAFSDDGGANFGPPIELDTPRAGRAPLGRVSIALADDDSAVVSYLASRREDAQILLRRVTRQGQLGPELRLGDNLAGRDAGFPRMARAGDSLVVIWTESGPATRLRAAAVKLADIPLTAAASADARASTAPTSAVGAAATAEVSAVTSEATAAGAPAPSLQALILDGGPAHLADLRGRVVLVNLWAIWCEPCRQELPVLAALHQLDAPRGLAIVAINIDRKRTRAEISDYVTRRGLPFTIWLDPADRAASALGATTFPFNVLIGRDGRIAWSRAGAIRAEDPELRAALDAALAAAPAQ